MNFIVIALYLTLTLASILGIAMGLVSRRFLYFFFGFTLLLRLGLTLIFESGLKYYFVIDSMKYEYDGWSIAKSWIAGYQDLLANLERTNLYTYLNAIFFYLFGNEPLVIMLFNSVIGTLTLFIFYRISVRHIAPLFVSEKGHHLILSKIYLGLLGLYPALTVWTTTNTKDPLYIFFGSLFVYVLFEARQCFRDSDFKRAMGWSASSLPLLYLIHELRSYGTILLALGVLGSMALTFLKDWIGMGRALVALGSLLILSVIAMYAFAPETELAILSELFQRRLSFTNMNLDDVAKSSFLIDIHLESFFDLFWFVPSALGYYFLGPFPWDIQSSLQAVGLVEAFITWTLAIPTYLGFRSLFQRDANLALSILTMVFVHALAQGSIISNVGTIFRHRSFPFCLLAIFTAVGLYEIWKKNSKNLLTT